MERNRQLTIIAAIVLGAFDPDHVEALLHRARGFVGGEHALAGVTRALATLIELSEIHVSLPFFELDCSLSVAFSTEANFAWKPPPMKPDLRPMLATLTDKPFDDPDWIFETKWDGFRLMAEIKDGTVALYSRNLIDLSSKYPSVCARFGQG